MSLLLGDFYHLFQELKYHISSPNLIYSTRLFILLDDKHSVYNHFIMNVIKSVNSMSFKPLTETILHTEYFCFGYLSTF